MRSNFHTFSSNLVANKSSSPSGIFINGNNDKTVSGAYEVAITQSPQKGFFTGTVIDAGVTFPFDSTGKDYNFTLAIDGTDSNTITLANGVYNTPEAMASAIQSAINADSNLKAVNASAVVGYDSGTNSFTITSSTYGASSNIEFTAVSGDFQTDLGFSVGAGTAGQDVKGTVNGVEGFGSGNILLPSLGEPGAGLTIVVDEFTTSATLNFSRGLADELSMRIDEFLRSDGAIATREESLNNSLSKLDDDEKMLDRRIERYQQRLIQQYINMERIISGLNSSGDFLDNLIDTLPFTAKNN